MFALEQVHIVDNGGQRRLDIVGHVGDQIRLQALALHLLLQGRVQADADVVDVLAHNPLFAVQPFQVHLQTGISLGNAADRAVQLVHLQRLGEHEMEN